MSFTSFLLKSSSVVIRHKPIPQLHIIPCTKTFPRICITNNTNQRRSYHSDQKEQSEKQQAYDYTSIHGKRGAQVLVATLLGGASIYGLTAKNTAQCKSEEKLPTPLLLSAKNDQVAINVWREILIPDLPIIIS